MTGTSRRWGLRWSGRSAIACSPMPSGCANSPTGSAGQSGPCCCSGPRLTAAVRGMPASPSRRSCGAPVRGSALSDRCSFPEDHPLYAGPLPLTIAGVNEALHGLRPGHRDRRTGVPVLPLRRRRVCARGHRGAADHRRSPPGRGGAGGRQPARRRGYRPGTARWTSSRCRRPASPAGPDQRFQRGPSGGVRAAAAERRLCGAELGQTRRRRGRDGVDLHVGGPHPVVAHPLAPAASSPPAAVVSAGECRRRWALRSETGPAA